MVMIAAAKEVVPSPVLVDAVCDIDTPSRTIAIRLSELERGATVGLWKDAHQALKASQEAGWRGSHPTLYASTPSARNVAHGLPGDWGMLLFRFPPGVASFLELIGRPRLVARVALDRSSRYFISVNFKHRP